MHFFWVQSISNISVCFPAQYSLYTNPPAESLGIKYDYNDIIDGSLYHLCDDDDDGDDDDDDVDDKPLSQTRTWCTGTGSACSRDDVM